MRTVTLTIDEYDQKLLTHLLGVAMGNTLNPEEQIAPKVSTGLEYSLLLDLLCRVTGSEAKNGKD